MTDQSWPATIIAALHQHSLAPSQFRHVFDSVLSGLSWNNLDNYLAFASSSLQKFPTLPFLSTSSHHRAGSFRQESRAIYRWFGTPGKSSAHRANTGHQPLHFDIFFSIQVFRSAFVRELWRKSEQGYQLVEKYSGGQLGVCGIANLPWSGLGGAPVAVRAAFVPTHPSTTWAYPPRTRDSQIRLFRLRVQSQVQIEQPPARPDPCFTNLHYSIPAIAWSPGTPSWVTP
ncbi:hypothetical protein MSAN_00510800 [Mycena sanguinolenta]|uniref:Uncharacterized protein n=1 Tax=Mycena sanguinolenta TaxID=230812 RepID=A0A8H7DI19_9AGAR|nr:hypothetical protein MSAN_00510800 [Mycena sanguinolenta]